ncbi:MAG TPA: Nif3-like dinuclear metal center hexameric protein [Actinomycetota bacterium]
MSGSPTAGGWIAALDELFPPAWAEAWDNVGLQVGDRAWPARRALVALDPTEEVVAEAVEWGCGLVVTHHPLLFRPRSSLDLRDPVARVAAAAIRAEIAIVACHTNADVAMPGVSDALAEALGIEVTGVLQGTGAGGRAKLVTFVPPESTAKVLDAVAAVGAGVIGEYTHCSFRVTGTGTFLPTEAADPLIGERGELNQAEEDRVEIVVPRERVGSVVEALLQAHPYDEVAYDVYPLTGPTGLGLGRVGRLPDPITAGDLALACERELGARPRMAGDPRRPVELVAVCGGSGASLIPEALAARVHAFVTGDVKHHAAQDAAAAGLVVIDAGHHATEWPFVPRLAERLSEAAASLGGDVIVSDLDTDPFRAP